MAYDASDGYLLLTGGVGASGTLAETWTFAGSGWENVTGTVQGPAPPRAGGMAVYDPNRGAVLVLGGNDPWPGCAAPAPIEQYAHGLWSELSLQGSANLSTLISGGAIFDGDGPFTLVVGGVWSYAAGTDPPSSVCVALGISAGLEGSVASSFTASSAPPAMESFGLAYYPGSREALLFGGDILGGSSQLVVPTNQSWAFTLPKVVVSVSRSTIYPEANESVNFTGVANRTDGALTMSWNFGDGSAGVTAGPNVSHTYSRTGVFSVSLNASDPNGTYATSTVLVSVAASLSATILVTPLRGAPPLTVTLRAVISGGYAPYEVNWTLSGPGTTLTGTGNITSVPARQRRYLRDPPGRAGPRRVHPLLRQLLGGGAVLLQRRRRGIRSRLDPDRGRARRRRRGRGDRGGPLAAADPPRRAGTAAGPLSSAPGRAPGESPPSAGPDAPGVWGARGAAAQN